ncbi:sulfate permease [Nesterenkonia sp. HG001]|uniref:sulfate permease n=1 Tax=Nesterenkonia sp. HG001 TaxID=2983207 RepID=UPI002AC6D069|nr:sulfate permease [Nesterenkonia sp. HG001]MDZ5079162.1 sulfate permease [Nesterenkonia sp. HG001]
MLRLLIVVSLHARNFLRCYMPTNILADAIRARRGMKWGPAVMLLAVPYFTAAIWLAGLIDRGAPGWLHLVVLLTIWNGFKMLWLGPASVAWLIRARLREAGAHRREGRAAALSSGSTV